VLAPRDVHILAAGVDTNDAVLVGRGISLRPAIALDAQQLEVDLTNIPARIFEGQRKITVDAVSDLTPSAWTRMASVTVSSPSLATRTVESNE
jgi:hypothetical protein